MSFPRTPHVGAIVHYVSFGTPGGEYTSQCRAAMVTEIGQWVDVEITPRKSYDKSEGHAIRNVEQWYYHDAVALAVVNPTGLFFNGAGTVGCKYANPKDVVGGTWHWPESG